MNKTLISAVIALTVASTPVLAAEKKLTEDKGLIGFGSGVALGAVVAGPIGAVVAGTMGIFIGELANSEDQKKIINKQLIAAQQASESYGQKNQTLARQLKQLELNNQHLNDKLTLAKQTINTAETMEQLKLNLQFAVNSSDVQNFYHQQLSHLAQLIKLNPKMTIQLAGFADRNGEDDFNLNLSAARVESVKQMLIKQGVDANNIITKAYGETAPMHAKQSYQGDFYDRRVEIKLQPTQVLTAGNN